MHATDDLNVDNNTVLPQAEGYQDQSTHNEVDIESRDKGDSTPNGNDIDVPDKGDSTPKGNNTDVPDKGNSNFNKQDIFKEENLLQITKKWNLPLVTVSLTDLDTTIKNELAKKGMIHDIQKPKPKPAGSLKIKEYGIKHTQKQKKKLPCTGCEEIFTLVKDFNIHMKEKHPDLKFRCQHCPKVYDTYNVRYKHEYKHFQLPYKCRHCDKRFLFPGLRAKHEKQHTGVGLLPCTWPHCKVKLSCPDALRQHIVTHTEEHFPCSKCPKDFNTITNLKQHMKGKHGDGFIALCGAVYDWSDQRMHTRKIAQTVKK